LEQAKAWWVRTAVAELQAAWKQSEEQPDYRHYRPSLPACDASAQADWDHQGQVQHRMRLRVEPQVKKQIGCHYRRDEERGDHPAVVSMLEVVIDHRCRDAEWGDRRQEWGVVEQAWVRRWLVSPASIAICPHQPSLREYCWRY